MDDATLTADGDRRSPSEHTPAHARLRVIFPLELVAELELGAALIIGRKPEAPDSLAIIHPTVSRQHAKIERAAGGHAVVDLGSHNGSWVDGARVGKDAVVLHPGSILRLGDIFLAYESAKAAPVQEDSALLEALPGVSNAMVQLRSEVRRAASSIAGVLISGETGAGKERVAREIHHLSGRTGAFVAFNTNEISAELFTGALFGHEPGAFTGADAASLGLVRSADRGTLFLDEIGELEMPKQVALLRLLEEREVRPLGRSQAVKVDVRFLAATNRDLREEVTAGRFRRDLYARLSLVPITVPPLSERRMDLPDWLARFDALEGASARPLFTAEGFEAVLLHHHPENLRGLMRLVHAARARPADQPLGRKEVLDVLGPVEEADPVLSNSAPLPVPTKLELEEQMKRLGSVRAVAKHFGRDRRQIYRWLDAHGLRR